jgi:hypothetical protein
MLTLPINLCTDTHLLIPTFAHLQTKLGEHALNFIGMISFNKAQVMNRITAPRGGRAFTNDEHRTENTHVSNTPVLAHTKPFWLDNIYECLPEKDQTILKSLRVLALAVNYPMSSTGFATHLDYKDTEKYSKTQLASRHLKHLTHNGLALQTQVGMYDLKTRKGLLPIAKYGYTLSELGVYRLAFYESMPPSEQLSKMFSKHLSAIESKESVSK